ncbi:MAG: hypothetical protein JWM33_1550, partial [Caulobacteraceae bacterium]|nr:hypothetical protein [Caulobacteraceae bacterium]
SRTWRSGSDIVRTSSIVEDMTRPAVFNLHLEQVENLLSCGLMSLPPLARRRPCEVLHGQASDFHEFIPPGLGGGESERRSPAREGLSRSWPRPAKSCPTPPAWNCGDGVNGAPSGPTRQSSFRPPPSPGRLFRPALRRFGLTPTRWPSEPRLVLCGQQRHTSSDRPAEIIVLQNRDPPWTAPVQGDAASLGEGDL